MVLLEPLLPYMCQTSRLIQIEPAGTKSFRCGVKPGGNELTD